MLGVSDPGYPWEVVLDRMGLRISCVGEEIRQTAAETSLSRHVLPPSSDMRSPCRTAPNVSDPGGTGRICTLVATERVRAGRARMSRGTQGPCGMLTRVCAAWRPRTVTLQSAPESAPRCPHVVPESPADESSGPSLVVRVADCCLGVPVIADEIAASLAAALVAAGLPEPKKLEVTPATSREHGDFQSSVALGCRSRSGRAAPRSHSASRAHWSLRRHRTWNGWRLRVRASSTSSSHPPGCTRFSQAS